VHADDPLKLRGYRTESHQIFKRCSEIIANELFLKTEVGYYNPFWNARRRMKVNRPISPILTLKLVVMATSGERSEKEDQILNLRANKKSLNAAGQEWRAGYTRNQA